MIVYGLIALYFAVGTLLAATLIFTNWFDIPESPKAIEEPGWDDRLIAALCFMQFTLIGLFAGGFSGAWGVLKECTQILFWPFLGGDVDFDETEHEVQDLFDNYKDK